MNLKIRIRSFAHRMEIDRAVLYALLARVWGLAASPVTVLLIAAKFTPTMQGFYYTFGSILLLQTFAELGIGVAITQFASHEWANLRIGKNRTVEGDPNSLSRLASLVQIAFKWYFIAAVIAIVGLSIGGYVFFSQSPTQNVSWKLPWISLCVFTGINLFTIAIWSVLEGCNQISNVYYWRFFQRLLSNLVGWGAILLGADLWTASIMAFAGIIFAGFFLRRDYWEFFKTLLLKKSEGPRISWRTEILPFQWRIAVDWVYSYFILSLFTPVIFYYNGPIIAGQMGMTWSLVSVLSTTGLAWVLPRVPQFGILVAQKRYDEMDRLFWRLMIIVTGSTILVGAAIFVLVLGLNYFDHFLARRLLSPLPTALFLIATIIYTASGLMAVYLRAHKKEPFLFISILLVVLVGLSTWLLGKHYSVLGIAAGYLTIYVMIFPITVFVWRHWRIKLHGGRNN